MRNTLDNRSQNFFYPHTRLTGSTDYLTALAAKQLYDFILYLFRHGTRHIALIDDRNNFQIMLNCHIKIGDCLCLYTLRSVYNQQCTFTSGNRTGNFIRKVYVPRSINQIQNILFTLVRILHLNGMALNGDTSLFFQIHIIQHLSSGHLYGVGIFKQTVS